MTATLRSRLILLVLVSLLPGLLAGGWVMASAWRSERQAQERRLEDLSRALHQVVTSELARRATVAQVLAQSRTLDAGAAIGAAELRQFDSEARRAMQGLGGWVELHAPGRVLLDTRHAPDEGSEAMPPGADAAAALGTAPKLLPLHADDPQHAHVALLEPVQRGGLTLLNLRVTVRPAELQALIGRQSLPAQWLAVVLDDRGRLVASHPGGASHLGHSAGAEMLARLHAGRTGSFEAVLPDGKRSMGFNHRGPDGWRIVTAMPQDLLAGTWPRAVLPVAVGGLLLLAVALGASLWLAGRIARPVRALKLAATGLLNGDRVAPGATGMAECDEVAQALAAASTALHSNRIELERQVASAVERTRQAEKRLSQSQRIEALGRLTGGVAHDFNNLLGVISNSAYLIERQAQGRPELQRPVAATLRAVEVGSRLTQHLLRVAGQRPVRPEPVVLGRFLPDMEDLLRMVLGRQVSVVLRVAEDTCPVLVDPSELELALINLALNARDALPGPGELCLSASNLEYTQLPDWAEAAPKLRDALLPAANQAAGADEPAPRQWVEIVVSDTGPGMASEIAARVFEPFFTTKPVGRGTGLGLSQVHGFCVQAGGAARIDATPGAGTTVRLLLPAQASASMPGHCGSGQLPRPAAAEPGLAGSRVLLVEDNLELAGVTAELLRAHGAEVEHASDGTQALRLMDTRGPIDLVLSDVVMPGPLDGLALARQLRREQPRLPIVLISGFAAAEAAPREFRLLRKPCSQAELLTALGEAIAAGTMR